VSRQLGAEVEDAVQSHLLASGLRLVARNFLCKVGEIDLIMCDAEVLAIIEVRYRKSNAYGTPEESVTHSKQRKLFRTAQVFLQRFPKWSSHPCRFDVVAVEPQGGELSIRWIKNAFTG
jgi:putative endonuclease